MKFEYKGEFQSPKKEMRGFFFSNQNVFKNLENAKNAILQILTLVLFYRLIVATHIGLGRLTCSVVCLLPLQTVRPGSGMTKRLA